MLRQKGQSFVMWTITFSFLLAALFFLRTPLKRVLQGKIMRSADYLLWTSVGEEVKQYKGDTSSFVKTAASQTQNISRKERNAYIDQDASSDTSEKSVSSAVEDGAQALLKTFDLNEIVP